MWENNLTVLFYLTSDGIFLYDKKHKGCTQLNLRQ